MRPTRAFSALPLLAALSLLPAPVHAQEGQGDNWLERCRRSNNNDRQTHCEERETRLPARGSLVVDGRENGGVSVKAWDRDEILVRARIQTSAPSAEAARGIASRIRVETDGEVRATGPQTGRRESWAVSYEVFVPRRTDLRVTAHNGPISVERVSGTHRLRTENGPLSLRAVSGDVQGRTTNGPVNVALEGDRWNGRGLDVETTNGPVTLTLPNGYSAELEASTVNGPVSLGSFAPASRRPARHVKTTLGNGGAPIRAVTTNGPVSLRRN